MNDPITLDVLVQPVLASDGHTYSENSLRAAMAADPWHRSPVTGEVLRPLAYPNCIIAQAMGGPQLQPAVPVTLFTDVCATLLPPHHVVSVTLPRLLDVKGTATRRALGLPDAELVVTLHMVQGRAMVPPGIPALREALERAGADLGLVDLLPGGIDALGGATVSPPGTTLEALLLARLCSRVGVTGP